MRTLRRASSSKIFVRVSEQNDRLFRMIDDFVGEVRLIVEDQRDVIFARECLSR